MNKAMVIVFGAAMLVLGAGCKETAEKEQPAAVQSATEHPATEHPAGDQAPKDHPAH